jgi:putative endonuclease
VSFFVYILLNPEGKAYVGQTANLNLRVAQHNDPECRLALHTKRHPGPWRLLHSETISSRRAAMHRERELKSGKWREWIRRELLRGC